MELKVRNWKAVFFVFGIIFFLTGMHAICELIYALMVTHSPWSHHAASLFISFYGLYFVYIHSKVVNKYMASDSTSVLLKHEWEQYIEYLKDKYPSDDWQLTCPYHKNINELIKKM